MNKALMADEPPLNNGDKKGKGGRPSHSCWQCQKAKCECSLKRALEGTYEPCDR